MNTYRKLVSMKSDGSESDSESSIERLLKQLQQVNLQMQTWVSTGGSEVLSHTLTRHQEILQDLTQVFLFSHNCTQFIDTTSKASKSSMKSCIWLKRSRNTYHWCILPQPTQNPSLLLVQVSPESNFIKKEPNYWYQTTHKSLEKRYKTKQEVFWRLIITKKIGSNMQLVKSIYLLSKPTVL